MMGESPERFNGFKLIRAAKLRSGWRTRAFLELVFTFFRMISASFFKQSDGAIIHLKILSNIGY